MRTFLTLMMITFFLSVTPADAQDLERYTHVSIIPERTSLDGVEQITIATQIKLAPHWHVYWENPGDSGLPVKIEWETPEGFSLGEIQWPTPDKISYDILANYGYYDDVVLLQTLNIPENLPKETISLTATLNLLVCNEICIPENDTITITLNTPGEDHTEMMDIARAKLPTEFNGTFEYMEKDENLILTVKPLPEGATIENLEFFPANWGVINHVSVPTVSIENDTATLSYQRGDQPLDGKALRGLLVVTGETGQNKGHKISIVPGAPDKGQSLAAPAPAKEQAPPPKTAIPSTTWYSALVLAIMGGIILNLMPCVFPVLSMKALSLVKMNDKERTLAKKHGLAYTLGVVLSFIAIGAALLVLKEAGSSVGWGFQLQSPIIVALLAYLLFLIGLNLIGFFEFGAGLSHAGDKLTKGSSLSSSFFTGALATIVATPCTAPFMGTAMGFAITQPAIISLSIFAALGFGLALPYLVLSYVPALRAALPKPGPWMDIFKQFLAFPIFASAIWLVWVLSEQAGSYGVFLVLLGMLAISFCVWLSHLKSKGHMHFVIRTLFILCLFLPFFSLSYIKTTENMTSSEHKVYAFGKPFTPERLDKLLERNDPVFVEMTAAWCITCKVNNAVALNVDSTKDLFAQNNVQYLIGDWTNYDDKISRYLEQFGRNGVPIYVYYGQRDMRTGKRPDPVVLPQLITPAIIKKAVEQFNS